MKRKFVKVMLFGALTLATTATITSCKDYDDDVANLQEQIDKITSTSPVSTEDMKAAISSAKSDLESQLATLKSNLENKDALISDLSGKVSNLEKEIENAADKETVNQLTKDLAAAKTELDALTKLQASDVEDLQGQISALEELVNTLNGLKDSFATKAELEDYVTSEDVKGIISTELATALGDNGKIATAINNAIKTQVLVKFGSLDAVAALAGENGTVAQVITDLHTAINADKTGILARLTVLEDYKKALEDKAKEEGFDGGIKTVIAEVASLKNSLSGVYGTNEFKDAVKTEVEAQLKDATSELGQLQQKLEDLGIAIRGMIQSVVYIPQTMDGSIEFSSLYAKEKTTSTKYTVVAKSTSEQELEFRISPAGAVKDLADFNKLFTIEVNAEERPNWTRAAGDAPFVVEATSYNAGILKVSLKTTAADSYAVSLNIKSTDNEVSPTDINSNYFAVLQSKYYLKEAYYVAKNASQNQPIIFTEPTSVAEFADQAVLKVKVSSTENGAATEKAFADLNLENIFSTVYTVNPTTYFTVSTEGVVSLKSDKVGLADAIGKKATVAVEVKSDKAIFASTSGTNPANLGTVEAVRKVANPEVSFGAKKATWKSGGTEIASTEFPAATIYTNKEVNITAAAYKNLTVDNSSIDKTKPVYFEVGADNALSIKVLETATGTYENISVVLKSETMDIKVLVDVTVEDPAIANLITDSKMWAGSDKDGKVGFSPTLLPNYDTPNDITVSYDLSKLFTNYSDVYETIYGDGTPSATTIAGASLEIEVADADKIAGITYDKTTSTLTFDKDAYTGKTKDGKEDAVIKFTATVKLGTRVVQTYSATVSIDDISGSWIAPQDIKITLDNKAKTYAIAEGFVWNDLRGIPMWKDGAEVKDDTDNYGSNVQPLGLYGLKAPKFSFVTANPYLNINASTGDVTFTEYGKSYNFVDDVTVEVVVTAESQWGTISGYAGNNKITLTIPKR